MPAKKLKEFLDKNKVKYITTTHSIAYTAQEVAELAHVSAKKLAKVVIVSLDGKDCMVVVPADVKINLDQLTKETGAKKAELASEQNFEKEFPDCELGAMPPFGNLYEMDVYVAESLADRDQIVFNAGTHSELIQLAYKDFEKHVKPRTIALT